MLIKKLLHTTTLYLLVLFLSGCAAAEGLIGNLQTVRQLGGRQVHGDVLPLSVADGSEQHLIVINQQLSPPPGELLENPNAGNDMSIFLSYLQPEGDEWMVRWEQNLGSIQISNVWLRADDTAVYAMVEDTLRAWSLDDGVPLWESVQRDSLMLGCVSCLRVAESEIVVLTQDRYLHAIDKETGKPRWEVRLRDDNRSRPQLEFTLRDGQVIVLDKENDEPGTPVGVSWYALADGSLTRHLTPTCASDPWITGIAPGDAPIFNETGDQMTFVVDGVSDATCLLQIDLRAGTVLRAQEVPAQDLPISRMVSSVFHGGNLAYLLHEGVLYTTNDAGALISFATETGAGDVVTAVPDLALIPQTLHNDILIARTRRLRGSEQDGLAGVDLASGEVKWQHDVQNGDLFGVDSAAAADWVWVLIPDGLLIIEVVGTGSGGSTGPYHLLTTLLNPETGETVRQVRTDIDDGFWTGLTWANPDAYLTIRNLYRVDLTTGETHWEWPLNAPVFEFEE